MSRYLWKALFLVVMVCITVVAARVADTRGKGRKFIPPEEYGTIILNQASEKNKVPPVVFRHWVHRSKHTCRLCHVDIGFAMEKGVMTITERDNQRGRYCGVCHNGKEAFGPHDKPPKKYQKAITSNWKKGKSCSLCHTREAGGWMKEKFYDMAAKLPRGRFGNKIDWEKAEAEGKIKPKDFIKGVSFPKRKIKIEKSDVDLDAKIKGLPDIIFSHKKHSAWTGCEMCHPDPWTVKKKGTKFTMEEIFQGQYCGLCHGVAAFPVTDCGLCHMKSV